jgi:hypothetical protein
MKRPVTIMMLAAGFALCAAAPASAQEETPPTFVYATYFECDVARQEQADFIVKAAYAPVYDAAVDDGTIASWGWMAHQTGGKWRRLLYYSARGLEALVDAPDAINPKIAKANPAADEAFSEICGTHDDYIWQVEIGSRGAGEIPVERGKVGMSVYFDCDMSNEDEADEIITKQLGPIYNAHIGEGQLASWGWLQHYVGGKWRRAATTTAADLKTLLATRNAIFAEVNEKAEAAGNRFGEICGSHQDYIWEILHEKP